MFLGLFPLLRSFSRLDVVLLTCDCVHIGSLLPLQSCGRTEFVLSAFDFLNLDFLLPLQSCSCASSPLSVFSSSFGLLLSSPDSFQLELLLLLHSMACFGFRPTAPDFVAMGPILFSKSYSHLDFCFVAFDVLRLEISCFVPDLLHSGTFIPFKSCVRAGPMILAFSHLQMDFMLFTLDCATLDLMLSLRSFV